jgi:hypothetical protein
MNVCFSGIGNLILIMPVKVVISNEGRVTSDELKEEDGKGIMNEEL